MLFIITAWSAQRFFLDGLRCNPTLSHKHLEERAISTVQAPPGLVPVNREVARPSSLMLWGQNYSKKSRPHRELFYALIEDNLSIYKLKPLLQTGTARDCCYKPYPTLPHALAEKIQAPKATPSQNKSNGKGHASIVRIATPMYAWEFVSGRRRCWKLNRALYGLRISPKLWQQEASKVLTKLGLQVVPEDPCLFVKRVIIPSTWTTSL